MVVLLTFELLRLCVPAVSFAVPAQIPAGGFAIL